MNNQYTINTNEVVVHIHPHGTFHASITAVTSWDKRTKVEVVNYIMEVYEGNNPEYPRKHWMAMSKAILCIIAAGCSNPLN